MGEQQGAGAKAGMGEVLSVKREAEGVALCLFSLGFSFTLAAFKDGLRNGVDQLYLLLCGAIQLLYVLCDIFSVEFGHTSVE